MAKSVTPQPSSTAEQNQSQALSVKRAQVEFHNFASLGEPERASRIYAEENVRRGAILRKHLGFIGPLSPFLEVGANAGHTSYMLANEFGAPGFALDISADALRHGIALQQQWGMPNSPVRIAGDALNLPFRDGSLRFVMTFQTLSQFMDLDGIFKEINRVLAPGGTFFFSEEPIRRLLSLRLYRCPYYETMKGWERKLYDWGLLGYIVRDVIGANQEESFGIRQNHSMYLNDWRALVERHFVAHEFDMFVPERGWGERVVKNVAIRADPYGSVWRAARLLGGTLSAVCRKAGESTAAPENASFEQYLRCPDCSGDLTLAADAGLVCSACSYTAHPEGEVYNLIRSAERAELYPGDRPDVVDFCLPAHEQKLRDGWHDLEGVYGNKFRWIGRHAGVLLRRVAGGPQRLRIRGHAHEAQFKVGQPVTVDVHVNGVPTGHWELDRVGLFILETDVPEADTYSIDINVSPDWRAPGDSRALTVNLSMIKLVPRD